MFAALATLMLAVTSTGGDVVLLDFRADWCGHCVAMDPTVQQLAAAGYPVKQVNIDSNQALAARFHVSSIPCFVLLVHGQEVQRVQGATSGGNLVAMFRRAGYDPHAVAAAPASGGDPFKRTLADSAPPAAAEFPAVVSEGPVTAPGGAGPAIPVANVNGPSGTAPAAELNAPSAAAAGRAPSLAICARLKVKDPNGNSIGSGTIIDARHGEGLILTCGHIFRDSDGKGEISVDLFGPQSPKNIHGRLVGCDLERDVALASFSTNYPLMAARVAPETSKAQAGDKVFTIGCSHGDDPTLQVSRVDSLDRFRGPANIQVAGQPVQGRSGGGLFNAAGEVIGVCNAADPTDNEGLFAALPSVYKELDRSGLTFIYRPDAEAIAAGAAASAPSASVAAANAAPPPEPADASLPAMPAQMPPSFIGNRATGQLASSAEARSLSPDELATLSHLHDKARTAEVICIVRSNDPQAKSEVIVIDKATPELMHELTGQSQPSGPQSAALLPNSDRRLTSLNVPAQPQR